MRRAASIAIGVAGLTACFGDKVVRPNQPLPALIAIDRPVVQFVKFALGRSVAVDTVRIGNNGEEALGSLAVDRVEYPAGNRTGWLAVTVVAQGPNGALLILRPSYVDTAGGPADTARVVVRAAGASQPRQVTAVVRTLPGARYEFSADPITFATVPLGPDSLGQAFSVRNGGNGDLPIRLPRLSFPGGGAGWLAAVPIPGGTAAAPGFQLIARPRSLGAGLHEGHVVFESPADDPVRARPDSFLVQLRIGQPRLVASAPVVTATAIRGGAPPAPSVLTLANAGEGPFASLGTLSVDPIRYAAGPAGWLAVTIAGDLVTIAAEGGALPEGRFAAVVAIKSEFGGTVEVPATLEVRLPGLTLSARTVAFNGVEGGTSPAAKTVVVTNSGSGTQATLGAIALGPVSFAGAEGWLAASIADSVITIVPSVGSLAAGTYHAAVAITSEHGGGDLLSAIVTVARASDPPAVAVSTPAVAFAGIRGDPNPTAQTVFVSNVGGGSLGAVQVAAGLPGWLAAAVVGGNVELRATTGSLAAGTQQANITVITDAGGSAPVAVTFTVGVPVLNLSASTVAFGATSGSPPTPASRAITIGNSGAGSVSSLGTLTRGAIGYGAGPPQSWLGATLSGPTLTLTATTGTLSPGTYLATFSVSSTNGGSRDVVVTFSVTAAPAPPDLAVSTNSLSFAAVEGGALPSPAAQTVTFYNSGGGVATDLGAVTVSVPLAATWLTALAGATSVTFTVVSVPNAGSHSTTATVTSAGGASESITVTLSVAPAATPPRLGLSASALAFATALGSGNPANQTVTVRNVGGGSLGTISLGAVSYSGTSSGWLSPPSLDAATGIITVSPLTTGLPAGASTATFAVSSSPAVTGSPAVVTVGLTVSDTLDTSVGSRLTVSRGYLAVAADSGAAAPANQTILVSNTGSGSLGSISLGAPSYSGAASGWLTANYSPSTDLITVAAATAGLGVGVSTATFTVSASNASSGSPTTVTVRLAVRAVTPSPQLALSASSLSFAATHGGPAPAGQTIIVSNAGGGTLGAIALGAVSAGAATWLSRSLTGSTITVAAATGGLAVGTHTGSFTVTASGETESVTVQATVAPTVAAPALTLSTEAVSFATQAAGTAPAQTVLIINTGGGDLAALGSLTAGPATASWLAAAVAPATGLITLSPGIASLAVGTYSATVPVTSTAGGSSAIAVSLTVAANDAPATLQISLTAVTFTAVLGAAAPAPQTVTLTNVGGGSLAGLATGTVAYAAGQPTGWLPSPGSNAPIAGTAVSFAVGATGLAAGAYRATVPITSTNGGTKSVAVTLTVEAPILTLSAKAVGFGTTQGTTAPPAQTVTVSNTGIGTLAHLGQLSIAALSYQSGEPTGWLGAGLAGSMVTLSPRLGSLGQGTFTARVRVASQFGGAETVVVTYTVAPGAAPPVLALSAEAIAFTGTLGGSNPAGQTVTATNAGGQTLGALAVGTIAPPSAWLAVTQTGAAFAFGVDLASLPAGRSEATVPIVSANAGSRQVTVVLTVEAPRLALSAAAVTFGDTVGSRRTIGSDVFVSNRGAGDLAALGALRIGSVRYQPGEPTEWLLSPLANSALSLPIVELRARVAGLAAGRYRASVEVTTARGGAETISVTLAVNRPDPSFDQPSIEFAQGARPVDTVIATVTAGDTAQTALRLVVRNPDNTALTLTGLRVGAPSYQTAAGGWITGAFFDKTSAPFGAPAELLVAINPRGMAAGRHRATLEISASGAKNSPKTLFVELVVR